MLVLLKYLLPNFELIIDIILLIYDERSSAMEIVLNVWYKRVPVVGVTIVTYIYNINQE